MMGLREELDRVGIRGRLARRIEIELADHIACDPAAQLGSPRLIAERFAEELRVPRTRRATFVAFGALALTALLLTVPQRGMSAAGGFPDLTGTRGTIESLGGLTILLGAQVAFVAGMLGLWRFLFSRDESRLVQQRIGVALVAGVVVVAGEATQAVAMRPALPSWWFALALSSAAVSAAGLGRAAFDLHGAVAITPRQVKRVRAFPWPLVLAIGASVVLLVGVGSAFAEHSAAEGLARGVIEGAAFVLCFVALGRRVGIRR
jgi:hypothetical protein